MKVTPAIFLSIVAAVLFIVSAALVFEWVHADWNIAGLALVGAASLSAAHAVRDA